MHIQKGEGLVAQAFPPSSLSLLRGHYAIGHTRYSTTGSSALRNAQPFLIETQYGPLAVAHNGNLVNAAQLRQDLLQRGVGLASSSDTEIITMMLAGAPGSTWDLRIRNTMDQWIGAYSLVVLARDCVYAVRDPWGFRPLNVGLLPSGGHAVASETGALQTLGCEAIREVKPGEVVTLSNHALKVRQALPPAVQSAHCVFEHIYFSRSDNTFDGRNVHQVRVRLGEELAREYLIPGAEVVIPVPDTSIPAAIGYARASGIPYDEGFTKNRYIGRTFIQPTDTLRKQGIALKFNVIDENVRGKRVVMIDDSIVRGNTTGPLVKLLRQAGAKEVHVLVTCPPIRYPCFMGVDMGTFEELIANRLKVEEICCQIGCDSLGFLSLEGMMRAVGRVDGYCTACFTGQYPIPVDFESTKTGFEEAIG
jgi:amidophosphoribosyltransferase